MGFVYFARSMAGQSQTDVQTTPGNRDLTEIVCHAIRLAGHRPQFDIAVKGIDKAGLSAAEYIFQRDLFWLRRCAAMVADISESSTGVGFELCWAKYCDGLDNSNILVVAKEGTRPSAMIAGWIDVVFYRDLAELDRIIVIRLAEREL